MSQIIIYPQFLFSSLHKLIKETNLYGFAQLKLIELLKFFYVLLNHKPLNTLKGNKKNHFFFKYCECGTAKFFNF